MSSKKLAAQASVVQRDPHGAAHALADFVAAEDPRSGDTPGLTVDLLRAQTGTLVAKATEARTRILAHAVNAEHDIRQAAASVGVGVATAEAALMGLRQADRIAGRDAAEAAAAARHAPERLVQRGCRTAA
jgi:hypothetical protein